MPLINRETGLPISSEVPREDMSVPPNTQNEEMYRQAMKKLQDEDRQFQMTSLQKDMKEFLHVIESFSEHLTKTQKETSESLMNREEMILSAVQDLQNSNEILITAMQTQIKAISNKTATEAALKFDDSCLRIIKQRTRDLEKSEKRMELLLDNCEKRIKKVSRTPLMLTLSVVLNLILAVILAITLLK